MVRAIVNILVLSVVTIYTVIQFYRFTLADGRWESRIIIGEDKWNHFTGTALVAFTLLTFMHPGNAIVGANLIAINVEFRQKVLDVGDVLANVWGSVYALGIYYIIR